MNFLQSDKVATKQKLNCAEAENLKKTCLAAIVNLRKRIFFILIQGVAVSIGHVYSLIGFIINVASLSSTMKTEREAEPQSEN